MSSLYHSDKKSFLCTIDELPNSEVKLAQNNYHSGSTMLGWLFDFYLLPFL